MKAIRQGYYSFMFRNLGKYISKVLRITILRVLLIENTQRYLIKTTDKLKSSSSGMID
jgi:hypothetical protein